MEVFQSYIAEGGLIRLILIGAFVYYYSKQNKRIAELSAKIDFLKLGMDDLQSQVYKKQDAIVN
tara:strand:- start:152 stop:343 length:192 start_codon:yes stop_codon:yes gene_type:complete